MSVHSGHRQRVRERFLKNGLSTFEKHEALELLLYYCVPRIDTNELAHRLIERFKTVGRVLHASPEELMSVEGVGENTATYLSLLNELVRYVGVERVMEMEYLTSVEDCAAYLKELFVGMNHEAVYLLCLDAKMTVIGHYLICEGTVVSADIPVRSVVSKAISSNAVYTVLAHNHPGGLAIPSVEDEDATAYIETLLRGVGVTLLDHIIVSDNDYVSLKNKSGMINWR